MSGLIISTDRLISSSEARNQFGKLVGEVSENEGSYFVILENGKVAALLVNPNWLKDKDQENFPDLEKLRSDWNRYSTEIKDAMKQLGDLDKNALPKLLQ